MRRLPILLVVLLAGAAPVRAQPGGVALQLGTRDSLYSTALGEWRTFSVYRPPSAAAPGAERRAYPVLYLLDGEAYFHPVTGIVAALGTGLNGNYALPELIVVGVHGGDRRRDFTPTRATRGPYGIPLPPGWDKTGGGDRFLDFLERELAPTIEGRYPVAPYRLLVGHSMAGLLAMHAVLARPALFQGVVAIDPSVWWDDRVVVRRVEAALARDAATPRTLVVAQAGNNATPYDSGTVYNTHAIEALHAAVRDAARGAVRYVFRHYADEDHATIPLIATHDALRAVFAGYEADVPKAVAVPGYLTAHYEALSSRLGYRVLPPADQAAFVGMLATMPSPGAPYRRGAWARVMGTWQRDSLTGDARGALTGATTLVYGDDEGVRVDLRSGGAAGPLVRSLACRRVGDGPLAPVPDGCVARAEGDSVRYAWRAGAAPPVTGVLRPSDDGRSLVDRVDGGTSRAVATRRY